LAKISKPIWLIVHTGHVEELQQLINYANDAAEIESIAPVFLIISQTDLILESPYYYFKYYPASDFYRFVDRIYTACGYNSMQQTLQYREIHFFIPFGRRYDDQFLRAKYRKLSNNL